jgi:HlyD family secretion protein
VPLAIGTHGLYITFSSTGSFDTGDRWTISIPNTQASNYLTNLNAYESAKKALEQAQAALALKQAEARQPDLQAARAQVLSAQGQVDSAQAIYNNTAVRAPSSGTITKVNIKVGEQAVPSQEVMILQDVGDLHAEANVSEADIASMQVDQTVDYTFDALGPDLHFSGKVQAVNPASTVISGVVNYKVTASIENAPQIKPGMTANMTILVASKDDALVVPSNAILNKDGKKYVRIIDDPKTKKYHEAEVKTGLNADGGLVEIMSGLTEGQEIVTSISS